MIAIALVAVLGLVALMPSMRGSGDAPTPPQETSLPPRTEAPPAQPRYEQNGTLGDLISPSNGESAEGPSGPAQDLDTAAANAGRRFDQTVQLASLAGFSGGLRDAVGAGARTNPGPRDGSLPVYRVLPRPRTEPPVPTTPESPLAGSGSRFNDVGTVGSWQARSSAFFGRVLTPFTPRDREEAPPARPEPTAAAASEGFGSPLRLRDGQLLFVTGGFLERRPRGRHEGLDLRAGAGTEVLSTEDGVVHTRSHESKYGYFMIIRSADGQRFWMYHHMSRFSQEQAELSVGRRVLKGQKIGEVGQQFVRRRQPNGSYATVNTMPGISGEHLHLELRIGSWSSRPSDPRPYINRFLAPGSRSRTSI